MILFKILLGVGWFLFLNYVMMCLRMNGLNSRVTGLLDLSKSNLYHLLVNYFVYAMVLSIGMRERVVKWYGLCG